MSQTIAVAAEDELMLTLVTKAAEDVDAEVIACPIRRNLDWAGDWARCAAVIYDEDQVGGDTVEALEHVKWSMLVSRDEVTNWEKNQVIERIEAFIVEALRDQVH
jgi:hypothetical protein